MGEKAINFQPSQPSEVNEMAHEIARSQPEVRVSHREIEDMIREAESVVTLKLTGGDSDTIFSALENGVSVVFKPKSGELAEYTQGIGYKRERAAYVVSEFLGFKLVPPTVIRKMGGEIGSAQQFITSTTPALRHKFLKKKESPEYQLADEFGDELLKLWLFDIITMNADRHRGNILVKDKSIHAIDHGECFGDKYSSYEEFYGVEIPDEIIERISFLVEHDELKQLFDRMMGNVLEPQQLEKLQERIRRLVGHLRKNKRIANPDELGEITRGDHNES